MRRAGCAAARFHRAVDEESLRRKPLDHQDNVAPLGADTDD
jgi:hypothetical protein